MSTNTPRVDACIESVSKRFPSLKSTAYFEEAHQHITPLAREMEREIAAMRDTALSQDHIRQIFLANGFTIKDGRTDLKDYVYKAAYALIAAIRQRNVTSTLAQQAADAQREYASWTPEKRASVQLDGSSDLRPMSEREKL